MKKLLLICVISLIVGIYFNIGNATASSGSVYNKVNIDSNFKLNQVLVMLNETEVNRSYSKNDFTEVKCINVQDISGDDSNCKKTLLLTLETSSKEEILDCVNLLNERSDVQIAEPNYVSILHNSSQDDLQRVAISETWALDAIDYYEAYNYVPSFNNNVYIGIVDSGI